MIARRKLSAFLCGLLLLPACFFLVPKTYAQSDVDKLKSQIQEKQDRLAEIEKEIKKYESALTEVGAEKQTLQAAVNRLELERKKVLADISYTENKINSTDLQISELGIEINKTEGNIDDSESAIAEMLRAVRVNDNETLIELMLRHNNLSDFWNEIDALQRVNWSVKEKVKELLEQKSILENKKLTESEKREQLISLREQYSGQKAVLENNKAEKNQLLEETKSEEANYQTLLASKKAAKEKLQKEVQDIESELQFILDPNTIPTAGDAVFRWPLDNILITQYFGYTKFALTHYSTNMHNGVDLAAPVGTTIHAPLTATVRAIGNTDAVPGCYSWGKWVLLDHPNGLSTLFAHLSHIGVTKGQQVKTGDVVGYTGNTGYSTGPHLHYTLYVSEAVQVKQFSEFKSVTSCGAALSPFAAVEGYLDPLDYLPPAP